MGLVKYICKVTVFLFLIMPVSLLAEWTSPDILIDESWGGGSSEIGVHLGRVPDYDNFPSRYDVSDDGKKVIYDRMNKRFKIYDSKSEIVDVIDSPISFSISSRNYAFFIKNNIMLVGKKIYLFTIDGLLISVSDIPMNTNRGIDILIKSDDLIFIKDPAVNSQKWFTYSAEGELLETSYRRPLKVGRVNTDPKSYFRETMNKIAIEFEDEIHYIVQSSLDVDCYYYDKDSGGNLYCVNNDINKKVIRYNSCGRVVAEFTVPEDVFVETSPGSENQGIAPSYRVESQYYGLSIDSKGNAYANRRTASGYSLVKWPWKDSDKDKNEGPFIPQYIKAKPEAEYVNLVWKLSPQDPGCVTGYRLLRSETPNGETTEIAILGQGVEKTVDGTVEPGKTYYYKIQTLSDIANSEFTPEVSVVIE